VSKSNWVVVALTMFTTLARAQPVVPAPMLEPAPYAQPIQPMQPVQPPAQPEPKGFDRRPSDERLFLTPTELTLRPGSVAVEDDEVISARIAIGVARHLQLDLRIGGALVPGAGGGAFALPGAIVAGGGAGFALVGLVAVGAKVPIIDEKTQGFGVAVGYDMLDAFGLAAGGAGVVFLGAGAGGAGVVAIGGANTQFNLFTIAAGKHWGRAHLTAGTYVLDNHHYLPQAAGFTTACGAGGVGEPGAGGAVAPCGSGATTIERLPLQVQPFVGAERAIGKDSSLSAEILFHQQLKYTIAATGVRWFVWRRGPLRARLDIALAWTRAGYPMPWLGLGVHFR
jgi:hypothetical protein